MLKRMKEVFVGKVIIPKMVEAGVKDVISTITGFLGSVYFTSKIDPILKHYGVNIDQTQMIGGLTVALSAWSRTLIHYVQFRFFHIEEKETKQNG